ncbi:MAG: hypothetical protein ACJ790_00115 [Myxococcaceae bacterium]
MASSEESGEGSPAPAITEQSDRSLAEVGEAMTQELKKFEQLSDQLQKAPANSQKALERCAKLLTDVAASDERLGNMVRELVMVINRVRDRQHAQAEGIHQRALYIQQRTEMFQKLMERYAELGRTAAELNQLAMSIQGEAKNATNAEKNGEFVAGLQTLQESMGKLAEGAEILAKTSDEQDFSDIARNADSLRQQLLSTKNKVSLLQKSLPRV